MHGSIMKSIYLTLACMLLPSILHAKNEILGDWSFFQEGNSCVIGSFVLPDVSKMSDQELIAYSNNVKISGVFGSASVVELAYESNGLMVGVSLMSKLLNENLGSKSVIFSFGPGSDILELNGKTQRISGGVTKPYSYRNFIVFDQSRFLTDAVPLFRKHKSVTLVINGKKIKPISLRGFSAAFAKFQSC